LAFILAWDGPASGWEAGRPHRPARASSTATTASGGGRTARELARAEQPWSAFYAYEAARALLLPVDFLSSPNLESWAMSRRRSRGQPPARSPQDAFPYTLADGPRTWKIDSVRLDHDLATGRPRRHLRIHRSHRSRRPAHRSRGRARARSSRPSRASSRTSTVCGPSAMKDGTVHSGHRAAHDPDSVKTGIGDRGNRGREPLCRTEPGCPILFAHFAKKSSESFCNSSKHRKGESIGIHLSICVRIR